MIFCVSPTLPFYKLCQQTFPCLLRMKLKRVHACKEFVSGAPNPRRSSKDREKNYLLQEIPCDTVRGCQKITHIIVLY